ncbi:GTP-binding protein [Intestinibacillus massiliensis]|uniref:GTP-binding protein n=1 Tax=Intestinibacillus massiliensis TaxID=1871029 RepID=UPI000B35677E|nr:GTP-binding protein [Intestinibacillus massiliensis]
MTKIDIISGFLGAGKTTLIKKLLKEALQGEKVVLIENEFGEIGIDGGFLKEAGIQVTEMNSGCICCSLVGDFGKALHEVLDQFTPDRVLIEPSGVGKLSDVIRAVEGVAAEDARVQLNSFVTVADAAKCKMYVRNFGEFYLNQVESASAVFLSRAGEVPAERLDTAIALLREHNAKARIVTTPWDELTGAQLLEVMEGSHSLADEMLAEAAHAGHGHEHHHEHGEGCDCHGHDEHHHDEHGHEHHHEHGEDCDCGCHGHEEHSHEEHHHDEHGHGHHHGHGEDCDCGCHGHHHHGHDADEVFTSWGVETPRKYTRGELLEALEGLDDNVCGAVLRAKGIVPNADGGWLHFDYVPGEPEVRDGGADYTGRLCVIGAKLNEQHIAGLFHLA